MGCNSLSRDCELSIVNSALTDNRWKFHALQNDARQWEGCGADPVIMYQTGMRRSVVGNRANGKREVGRFTKHGSQVTQQFWHTLQLSCDKHHRRRKEERERMQCNETQTQVVGVRHLYVAQVASPL